MKFTIDAKNRKLGRVASEAASLLMGKQNTDFVRNKVPAVKVEIINSANLLLSEKKMKEKQYAKYSGYPGGLRFESMSQVVQKSGIEEVVRRAVYGMLPHNSLRPKMIKNLSIK